MTIFGFFIYNFNFSKAVKRVGSLGFKEDDSIFPLLNMSKTNIWRKLYHLIHFLYLGWE